MLREQINKFIQTAAEGTLEDIEAQANYAAESLADSSCPSILLVSILVLLGNLIYEYPDLVSIETEEETVDPS